MSGWLKSKAVKHDEVLFAERPFPYTLQEYYNFLESEHSQELLDFWISVQDYRNMFQPDHPRSSYSYNNWTNPGVLEDDERKTAEQIRITLTYIVVDAPLEVNIGDHLRKDILRRVPKEGGKPAIKLFDEAQREVENMLSKGPFLKFLVHCKKNHPTSSKLRQKARAPPPRPVSIWKDVNKAAPLPDSRTSVKVRSQGRALPPTPDEMNGTASGAVNVESLGNSAKTKPLSNIRTSDVPF